MGSRLEVGSIRGAREKWDMSTEENETIVCRYFEKFPAR
jgi:hypothetical protein